MLYLDAPGAGGRGHGGSCSGRGAPTLVLDSDVDEGAEGTAAARGWLCFPRTNRALLFRGGLLHGVVPASSNAAVDKDDCNEEEQKRQEAAEHKVLPSPLFLVLGAHPALLPFFFLPHALPIVPRYLLNPPPFSFLREPIAPLPPPSPLKAPSLPLTAAPPPPIPSSAQPSRDPSERRSCSASGGRAPGQLQGSPRALPPPQTCGSRSATAVPMRPE